MLGLEAPLRARLAGIGELAGVYGARELSALRLRQDLPGAYVTFDGYQVRENGRHGRASRITARWLITVAVRHAAASSDGAALRAAAAPLVAAVLGKLLGWQPGAPYGPLHLADPGDARPEYLADALRIPLAVTTELVVSGD